jgi:putative lipoprotein
MALMDRRRLAACVFAIVAGFLPSTAQSADVTISGSVFYRERMALPDNASLFVQLVDTTQTPAGVIGDTSVSPAGQVPIAFSIIVDSARVTADKAPGLMARIEVDGAAWFANDAPAPVDLNQPAAPLSVLLMRVAEKSSPENSGEAKSIKGVIWQLSSIDGQNAAAGINSTLTFSDDGNVSGNGGCNSFGGKATLDGAKLKFGDLFSTMMACEEAKMKQEAAFHAALAKTASYRIENGTLTLLDGAGVGLATLTAAS